MMPNWTRTSIFAAALFGVCACDSGTQPAPEPAPTPPEGAESPGPEAKAPAAKAPPAQLDLSTLKGEAKNIALTPSPAEMQKALANAGIAAALSDLVQKRKVNMDTPNLDRAAVRTGVLVADVVLTVKVAPKEDLVGRLKGIKKGMTQLGAGSDISATLDDLVNRIQNDAVSREVLVRDMDELSGVIIPEIKYEAGDQSVPLIQAGSWLEGANLVSTAIINAGKYEAANRLLRQPEVVDYFLGYVKSEDAKAPDEVIAKLEDTLTKLKEITSKEALTEEDVKNIHSQTDAVLALL